MANLTFPESPAPPFARPTPIEIVAARTPLLSIREALSISIHEVVNGPHFKAIVLDLYKVTRRMENEAWLRRRFAEAEYDAWIAAHL